MRVRPGAGTGLRGSRASRRGRRFAPRGSRCGFTSGYGYGRRCPAWGGRRARCRAWWSDRRTARWGAGGYFPRRPKPASSGAVVASAQGADAEAARRAAIEARAETPLPWGSRPSTAERPWRAGRSRPEAMPGWPGGSHRRVPGRSRLRPVCTSSSGAVRRHCPRPCPRPAGGRLRSGDPGLRQGGEQRPETPPPGQIADPYGVGVGRAGAWPGAQPRPGSGPGTATGVNGPGFGGPGPDPAPGGHGGQGHPALPGPPAGHGVYSALRFPQESKAPTAPRATAPPPSCPGSSPPPPRRPTAAGTSWSPVRPRGAAPPRSPRRALAGDIWPSSVR